MGHYQLLREITKGPLGPLYELRAVDAKSNLGGLGRLIVLPSELPSEGEQAISEAAWESMELRYDLALSVADVVFGKGWITLVHDHSEGTLLRSLQRRAHERQSAFPVAVALRVALDLVDGFEQRRSACDAAGITWQPGCATATSLYLCGDGRTRALDGQIASTSLCVPLMRKRLAAIGYPAPELLDAEQAPDERADVFAVGTVLWELLTGRELALGEAAAAGQRPRPKVTNINLSVPKGTALPAELTKIVHAALELDPANRPSTTKELRVALQKVGEVGSYEKVIDFTDALLNRESTLFRLTLDAGPKLSDELPNERPKPTHLEWAAELAKHARVAEAQRAGKAVPAAVVRSPQVTPATAKSGDQTAPRVGEPVSASRKPPPKKTLIGVAAASLDPAAAVARTKSTATARPPDAAPTPAKSSVTARPPDVAPAPTRVAVADEPREPQPVPGVTRSLEKKTLIGMAVPASALAPRHAIPEPGDNGSVQATSSAVAEPAPKPSPEPIAALIAQALPVTVAAQPPAAANGAANQSSPLSLDAAFMPISAAPPAAAPTVSKAPGKRVLELTLPTIALGLVLNTVLTVAVTLLIQKALAPASPGPVVTPVVSAQASAAPALAPVSVSSVAAAPTPEPPPAAAPSVPVAAAAESVTPPAEAKAPSAPVRETTAPAPAPVAPRPVVRKNRGQYVPHEL